MKTSLKRARRMGNRFKRSMERLLLPPPILGGFFWPLARAPKRRKAAVRVKRATPPQLVEVKDFGSNPGGLRMFAHIPKGLPAGRPLVLVLHGCRQDAESYDRASGWSALGDARGFTVVYALQRQTNNPARCFNWFRPSEVTRDRGELMSIRQMVSSAAETAKSDPARIFITGLSAGGAMTAAMLANYPEVFAGGAIIAGLPYGAARDATRALGAMNDAPEKSAGEWGDLVRAVSPQIARKPAIAIWHGTADRTVAFSNALALAAQWRDVYRLPEEGFVEKRAKDRQTRIWPDPAGRALVTLHAVEGLGHGTPVKRGKGGGYAASDEPFMLEAGFSSTLEIAGEWGLTPKPRK